MKRIVRRRRSFLFSLDIKRSPPLQWQAIRRPSTVCSSARLRLNRTADHKEIVSPMVGTFYRAPSPDSAPYIKEGQEIAEDSVVCIIEAMKVMNEIKAEVKGVITEVLVENGAAVQFGQPLFRVK